MGKPFVVLADLDATYLVPLEDKLTEELYDQIELEIITDKGYFDYFFSTPKRIDTLIISSSLYSQDLNRHNITDIFVLTEDAEEHKSADNVTHIFKYSSTKEIFNQVLYKNKEMLNVQFSHKETQVVVVTSAIGGAGKTTLSLALAQSLSRSHKRVLYLSTDMMQSFGYYLQNKNTLPNDFSKAFGGSDERLCGAVMPYLRNEGFTYLPPFGRTILSLGLEFGIYNRMVKAMRAAKEFDYIIVDTDMQLDQAKAELINGADKVIVAVLQDEYSTCKTEFLIRNIDCRNNEKFVFVCNKFRRDINNDYMASPVGQQFIIAEYIDDIPLHQQHSLDSFTETSGIRNLAYVLS